MRVDVGLLGGFTVSVDGMPVPPERWHRRQAGALVKVLALAPGARMHRDRVIDTLWPDADPATVSPRLHKAAHFARQALASPGAVTLRDEQVALFPGAALAVDALAFDDAANAALGRGAADAGLCTTALALYRGELLPDDLHEPWTHEARARFAARYERLLRGAGDWHALLDLDPADEQAHVELLRAAVDASDRAAALRRYDELADALRTRLGRAPGPEAEALHRRALTPDPEPLPRPRRATRAETLLEREEELAAFARIVRAVIRTGRGAVVLLTGEAGSGKSALVRAFLAGLDDSVTTAVGGCDDLLAPRGLAPFRDMVAELPELAGALAGGQPDEVFPALLRSVGARTSVVAVEDVHWADDVSLDAVRYLARRIEGVPAVLVLTYRPEDVGVTHPLRGVLGGLNGPNVRRIELAPLSVGAVARLAGVDHAEAAEIHRVTRGNPFFVTEVLDAGGDGVPPTVRDAVLARVGRLPAPVRRLAGRLAVVPTRAERWLAEALAGDDPDALVEAERSGVLGGGPEHVAFRHELARRAIETSLTVGEIVQHNREVLTILLGQPDPEPSRVVHHAERAVRPELLRTYGPVAAADAQRAGAHRQAAQTLHAVLRYADQLDPVIRAQLLTRRAYSLYVVNEYGGALADALEAVDVAESAREPVPLADALLVLSRIVLFAQGVVTAREAARRAVDILERVGDDDRLAAAFSELARAYSNLATLGVVAQPSAQGVAYAQRAAELADRVERDDLRAQALCYLGTGRLAQGDPAGAQDLDRGIAAGAEAPLEVRVRTYVNAAGGAYRAGRFDAARYYVEAGLRIAADGEFAAGRYRLWLTSAAVDASSGNWQAAIGELRTLVDSPERAGVMALLARSLLARLLARRGDPDAAAVLAPALNHPPSDSYVAGPIAVARVELGWLDGTLTGMPQEARAALRLAAASRHTAMYAELAAYLGRAGQQVAPLADAPGPWGPTLAGRHEDAAAAWARLGDRYEQAVELALAGDPAGASLLAELGAHATTRALTR